MNCRFLQRCRARLGAGASRTATTRGAAPDHTIVAKMETATAIAVQLRAQIPCSTDPERLERLACEVEGRPWPTNPAACRRRWFLVRRLRFSPAHRSDAGAVRTRAHAERYRAVAPVGSSG